MIEGALHDEPDFSGDDFINDKEIQRSRLEREESERMIDESISSVVSSLHLTKGSHINLKGFVMFKNLEATLIRSYHSNIFTSPLVVSVATYFSTTSVGRFKSSGDDPYFFGRLTLKNKYPPTYISRETIVEFIRDLVLKEETDFPEHKNFSRRFYVLTKDSHKLKQMLMLKPLDDLTAFLDMELELQDDVCLFRNSRRPLCKEEAIEFTELAKTVSRIFG